MTNKVQQMTLLGSFDARINTDGKTIHGTCRHLLSLPRPLDDGNLVYKRNFDSASGFEITSLNQADPATDLRL